MSTDPSPPGRDDCTTVEVARRLGLAVRSVQLMVDRGELEAWKTPGGHRRIRRQSVDRWLAGRQAGPSRNQRRVASMSGSSASSRPEKTRKSGPVSR